MTYTCTHCQSNYQTTEYCGILTQLNSGSRDDMTCYCCGKPVHIQPQCCTRQNGFQAQSIVNTQITIKDSKVYTNALLSEGSASQEDYGITPGGRHLFGLPCDASDFALISSATSWWVLVKRALNNIFNHQCCIISFNQPPSLIISNLGDETTVTATFRGFLTISQGKKFNSLYPPSFQLALVCINQLDLVG